MDEPKRAPHLPRIHPFAWEGEIGQSVLRIAPTTEADPVAILASSLALFGAMAGDRSYVWMGGSRHPARIWPLIVGKTGAGRKGTSWAEARWLAQGWGTYAEGYMRNRVNFGVTSGEGLLTPLGAGPRSDNPDEQPAAPDGKMMVIETEFARVLSNAKREGSNLGPVLRQLWDDGDAGIMTRATPLRVTGAHVAMIAHVTPKELRMRLAESDLAGGTLNRYLLVFSERPHLIAHEQPHADVAAQAEWLGKAVDRARDANNGLVQRNRDAEEMWPEVYGALSAEEPDGQLGSVIARGPAYTMRLALAYALADGARSIEPRHLLSGLALWHYAAETAKLVFPEGQRNDDLHRLAAFLADVPAGRTRTEISALFGRNRDADAIDAMLRELDRHGHLVVTREQPRNGPGRPTQRFFWSGTVHDGGVWALLRRYEKTN